MGLSARTAYVEVPAFFPKLAVPIELVVYEANLLLLPALGGKEIATPPCEAPLLLFRAVGAIRSGVVQALTSCAPILGADCLARKALSINAWVHPDP